MLVYESKKMNNVEFQMDSHPDIQSGWYARIVQEGDIPSLRRLEGPDEGLIEIPVFYELNKSYGIQKEELVWYDQWEGEWEGGRWRGYPRRYDVDTKTETFPNSRHECRRIRRHVGN